MSAIDSKNIKFKNSNFTNNKCSGSGGSIYMTSVANLIYEGIRFEHNFAIKGGAMSLLTCSNASFYDIYAYNNTSKVSGGVFTILNF